MIPLAGGVGPQGCLNLTDPDRHLATTSATTIASVFVLDPHWDSPIAAIFGVQLQFSKPGGNGAAKAHAGDEALVEVPAFRHGEVGQRLGACGRYGAVEDVAAVAVPLEEIPKDRLVALPRRLRDGFPAISHWKGFAFRSVQISRHGDWGSPHDPVVFTGRRAETGSGSPLRLPAGNWPRRGWCRATE